MKMQKCLLFLALISSCLTACSVGVSRIPYKDALKYIEKTQQNIETIDKLQIKTQTICNGKIQSDYETRFDYSKRYSLEISTTNFTKENIVGWDPNIVKIGDTLTQITLRVVKNNILFECQADYFNGKLRSKYTTELIVNSIEEYYKSLRDSHRTGIFIYAPISDYYNEYQYYMNGLANELTIKGRPVIQKNSDDFTEISTYKNYLLTKRVSYSNSNESYDEILRYQFSSTYSYSNLKYNYYTDLFKL